MDIYLTIEEKYLQIIEEIGWGEKPKALQLLNEIIADDPFYAKAHYQLGMINYYDIRDYQAAGYHFKTCAELAPDFPDVYYHYLHLLVFLGMEKHFQLVKVKALTVPGVNLASIYCLDALIAEKRKEWDAALEGYRRALTEATCKTEKDNVEESIERVKFKRKHSKKYVYELSN